MNVTGEIFTKIIFYNLINLNTIRSVITLLFNQIAIRGVTSEDLMIALSRTPPSVSHREVEKHEAWNAPRKLSEI